MFIEGNIVICGMQDRREGNRSCQRTKYRVLHFKATPNKDRLSALHAIFRQIFRHFRQNLLGIRQYSCVDFVNLTKNYARNLTRNLCAVLP